MKTRRNIHKAWLLAANLLLCAICACAAPKITFFGSEKNDLYQLLSSNRVDIACFGDLDQALEHAPKGTGLVLTASGYPEERVPVTQAQYDLMKSKKLRVYVEYPGYIPGKNLPDSIYLGKFDRGVITSKVFGKSLPEMSVLTVNDCHIIPLEVKNPLMVYAKVAGFYKAEYGLTGTDVYPLLFMQNSNTMVALSALSNYKLARFAPGQSWKTVWEYICGWLLDEKVTFPSWVSDPHPMYTADEVLPADARRIAVERGTEWLYKGIFFLHPTWKALSLERQGDTDDPSGPPLPRDFLVGDGCLGILEGHQSYIYHDGTQKYRYWRRCDVQGEVSYLLASSYDLLDSPKYKEASEKLMDFMFYESEYRQGAHNDKNSPVYGLLGWGDKSNWVFYSDDNARAILGAIGASALMKNERWNRQIVENILANFRTASRQGFHGERLHEQDIVKNGWRHYSDRDYTFINMNFESYCWALYLWLYDKTGYKPLLDKAKSAIKITMDAYPDHWHFLQGIQSEKGRFLLPLAWLVRAEDTPEHRKWLDTVIQDIMKDQDACGAIIENLGKAETGGSAGRTKSNASYGTAESPLNFRNTDKVADMLYTCNFMFLGFNEAYHATGNMQYKKALDKLADFLLRIQVKSESHPDVDGAWFRAFDFGRWDYWAENADAGWGAWSTLTGWIQSWIVGTHAMMEKDRSFWDATKNMKMDKDFQESLWMLSPLDVWTESSYVNVFKDLVKGSESKPEMQLVVARNESESFQVLLRSGRPFTIKGVTFGDLLSGNDRIRADQFDYKYVEYVYMKKNSWNQNEQTLVRWGEGYYPDPLSNNATADVKANETQPVWITLHVPEKARPGLYEGKAVVHTSAGDFPVDIRAEVNRAVVPDAINGHFDLMIHQQIAGTWFYDATRGNHPQDVIRQLYGYERWTDKWWALVGDMADKMRRSRMNVLFVNTQQLLLDGPGTKLENGRYTFDWSRFDQYIQFFIDKKAVNKLEGLHLGSTIGAVGKTYQSYILTNNEKGELCSSNVEPMSEKCRFFHDHFLKALYEHLKKKGWLDMWMQHIGDEAESELQHRQYAYYMERLKKQAPGMKCGDPTYTLKSAQNAVAHGATIVTPIEELYQAEKQTFDSMQQQGVTVYCYNCCGPGYNWLNRFIDKPVWNQRLLGWLCYKWGVSGWLHWGWNFWVEWFQTSFHSVDEAAFKGDHYSVYPDIENNKVKASIRTEALRDMSEENELLRILGKKNPELARQLVDKVASDASDHYTKDVATLIRVRNELIRACD